MGSNLRERKSVTALLTAVPLTSSDEEYRVNSSASVGTSKKLRRQSWHAIKFGDKLQTRRNPRQFDIENTNSSTTATINGGGKSKRYSLWNLFAYPVTRSRRASQDFGSSNNSSASSRTHKDNTFSWMRSKSRSIDHGMETTASSVPPPFNLDALRDKADGRGEKNATAKDDGGDVSGQEKGRKSVTSVPPENTLLYTVAARDTLTSVAAHFDTTPTELTKINRLATPYIFPGQQLYVPVRCEESQPSLDVARAETLQQVEQFTVTSDEVDNSIHNVASKQRQHLLDNIGGGAKPGRAERVLSSSVESSAEQSLDLEDQQQQQRFLKLNVRHITDGQGVVTGVLLVTPNAVMFDPNVSDPLVLERGAEAYGVIAPTEFVVNVAIYNDIAHMRVSGASSHKAKAEIYYPKPLSPPLEAATIDGGDSKEEDSLLLKADDDDETTFPELIADNESLESCPEREGDAFPKAFDRDLVTPTNLQEDGVILMAPAPKEMSVVPEEEETELRDEERSEREEAECHFHGEGDSKVLDHHWAIPSRDRQSLSIDDDVSTLPTNNPASTKECYHDSGIDIRETAVLSSTGSQKKYSDAEIVLSKDWVPPLTIVPTEIMAPPPIVVDSTISSCNNSSTRHQKHDTNLIKTSSADGHRRNRMLKRLSYPMAWMDMLSGDNTNRDESKVVPPTTQPMDSYSGQHSSSVFSKVFSRRSSVGALMGKHHLNESSSTKHTSATAAPKLDYRSMVSVEDMPELFASIDKLLPRPARPCDDPPMYLRLRMGKPLDKPIPRSTPLMSYGKKRMRPEYWFSVPLHRTNDLYTFIKTWMPHLYGELDEANIQKRGFMTIETDTDLWSGEETGTPTDDSSGGSHNHHHQIELTELTKESWEVLPMSEEFRRALDESMISGAQLDAELAPPDLVGTTEILTREYREALCRHLPARAEGYAWTLVFSTSQHGFSLNSLYRMMTKIESPILLIVQDIDRNVFGAITSCKLQVSEHFYGTGESLLFRFTPTFQAYNWTGDNLYFIKGNNDGLSIGAGDGKFGLWLDGDLYLGRSECCKTYANEPLTPNVDFVVKTLECWAFVSN